MTTFDKAFYDAERVAFEAWCAEYENYDMRYNREHKVPVEYECSFTQDAWHVWLARAERTAAPAVQAEPVAFCVANPYGTEPPVVIYGNGFQLKAGDDLYLHPPAPAVAEWIPCSERLPSSSGEYLVWVSEPNYNFGHPSVRVCVFEREYYGHEVNKFKGNGTVTHWQPLPTPPNGGEV